MVKVTINHILSALILAVVLLGLFFLAARPSFELYEQGVNPFDPDEACPVMEVDCLKAIYAKYGDEINEKQYYEIMYKVRNDYSLVPHFRQYAPNAQGKIKTKHLVQLLHKHLHRNCMNLKMWEHLQGIPAKCPIEF